MVVPVLGARARGTRSRRAPSSWDRDRLGRCGSSGISRVTATGPPHGAGDPEKRDEGRSGVGYFPGPDTAEQLAVDLLDG